MHELIIRAIEQGGLVGIFLLMALENIFPPIPSELIMPLAGYQSATLCYSRPARYAAGSCPCCAERYKPSALSNLHEFTAFRAFLAFLTSR